MVDLNSNGINAVEKINNPYFGFEPKHLIISAKAGICLFLISPRPKGLGYS